MRKLIILVLAVMIPNLNIFSVCSCSCYRISGICGHGGFNTIPEDCFVSAPSQAVCEAGGCFGRTIGTGCAWTR